MSSTSTNGLLAVCGTLVGLSTGAVALRFIVRLRGPSKLMAADWFAVAALLCYIGTVTCVFELVHQHLLGYASHGNTPPSLGRKSNIEKLAYGELLQLGLGCIKISAVLFYRRIFCTPASKGWFDIATKATIGVIVVWIIAFGLVAGLECGTHFAALWNGTYEQYCTATFGYLYGFCVSEFLLDVWILVLPIPKIVGLHASVSRRLSIFGLFLLAFIGLGASIARMVVYIQIEEAGEAYFLHHNEGRALTSSFFVDMLEFGMSLVAVNLPLLWTTVVSKTAEKVVHKISDALPIMSKTSDHSHPSDGSGPRKPSSGQASHSTGEGHYTTIKDMENQSIGNSEKGHELLPVKKGVPTQSVTAVENA